MISSRRHLQNQQMILKARGYYRGKCDGIWSRDTIRAKKEFERDVAKFSPCYPNNGMPFEVTGIVKLPAGIYQDPSKGRGMLTCDELSDGDYQSWKTDLAEVYDNRQENVHVPKETKPQVETVAQPATGSETTEAVSEPAKPEDKTVEQPQAGQKPHPNKHKQKQQQKHKHHQNR